MSANKLDTGIKDSADRRVYVGDLVECTAPIFTKPKRFVVEWDDCLGRYNYPTSLDLTSHCRVIDCDETN
jgi:hypothetical protein